MEARSSLEVVAVVVSYNSAGELPALAASIPAGMSGVRAEVVVVDNGSDDGSGDVAEELDWGVPTRVVRSQNRGYAAAINQGVEAAAAAEAVLVLNADVRLRPGAVRALLRGRVGHVGILAPKILDPSGRRVDSLRREPTLWRASGLGFTHGARFSEYVTSEAAYERCHRVDWATGAALLFSMQLFRELGGWDESYFLYSEETDFCLRARDAGWLTMYVPEAEVEHVGGASGRSDATHAMQIVNRVRLFARRNTAPYAWAYFALTALSELSWMVRGHAPSRASLRALFRPALRPAELALPRQLLPR